MPCLMGLSAFPTVMVDMMNLVEKMPHCCWHQKKRRGGKMEQNGRLDRNWGKYSWERANEGPGRLSDVP